MLVEMHAHVICGVDDGAGSDEEMRRMLTMAAKGGVERLVCTSHIRPGEADYPAQAYRRRLEEAQAWCREALPGLELYAGAEILYTEDTPQMLRDGLAPTLAGSRMVLVEFRRNESARRICAAVGRLQTDGWQVVLAHVERCRALRSIRRLRRLRSTGVLTQMNANTVFDEMTGYFRRRRVEKLLRTGMIDFVSSDAHDTTDRPFCLRYAWHYLAQHLGEKQANEMCGDRFAALMGWTHTVLDGETANESKLNFDI